MKVNILPIVIGFFTALIGCIISEYFFKQSPLFLRLSFASGVSLLILLLFWCVVYIVKLSKNIKPTEQTGEEFTFIWYKTMQYGNTVYYTKPFRTKIKAQTKTAAKQKLQNLVLQNLHLVICDEKTFSESELTKIQNQFDKTFEEMNRLMDKAFGKQKI